MISLQDIPSYLHVTSGPKLIGFHGHARSGKDTCAKYLHRTRSDTWTEAFAAPLKRACAHMFGVHEDLFFDDAEKEKVILEWDVSPRMMAQFVGTELVRNHMHKLTMPVMNHWVAANPGDHWIRVLTNRLNSVYNVDDTVCITDVRFQNEYEWIIANGGIVICLSRPEATGEVGIANHASESPITLFSERTYLVENNSTLEELYAKVDKIVNDSGIYPYHSPEQF